MTSLWHDRRARVGLAALLLAILCAILSAGCAPGAPLLPAPATARPAETTTMKGEAP